MSGFGEITAVKVFLTVVFEVVLLAALFRQAVRGESRRRRVSFGVAVAFVFAVQALAAEILVLDNHRETWAERVQVYSPGLEKPGACREIEVWHLRGTDPMGLLQRLDVVVLDASHANGCVVLFDQGWRLQVNGATYEGRHRVFYCSPSGVVRRLDDAAFEPLAEFCRKYGLDHRVPSSQQEPDCLLGILHETKACPELEDYLLGR